MDDLPLSTVFELLSNQRRLQILKYLSTAETAEVSEIAEYIAAIENDVPRDEVQTDERKRVFISLYQTHVPRLEDHGIVTYDRDEGVVSVKNPDLILRPFREVASGTGRRWSDYYLGVAAIGGLALIVLLASGIGVFTPVATGLIGTVLLCVTVVAVLHRREERVRHPDSLAELFRE